MRNCSQSCFPSSAALGAVGILFMISAAPAVAADWSVNPKVTASYEYDDNTRMSQTSAEAIDVSGGAIDAALELRADVPLGFFRLVPRLRSTFYPGDETEETDSQWVNMALRRAGERSQFDLRADYSRIETLGGYLPGGIGDPGGPIGEPNPGEGTGGRTEGPNREDRFLIAPRAVYAISERHGIDASAGYVDASYDQRVDQDREDYSYLFGALGYVYRVSPSKSLTFSVGGGRFEDEDGLTSGSRRATVEWRNQASEKYEFYARAGASQSEDDSSALDPEWETGFSGGIGVRREFEVSNLLVDLNSDLDPNSSGRLVQRDQLRLQFDRRLTPMLNLVTGVRLLRDEGTSSQDDFETREYANASIGLRWRFSRQWSVGGAYTYVWREYEDDVSAADANHVSLGITYEPNRR